MSQRKLPLMFLGLTLGLLVVDQLTKAWARNAAEMIEGRTFLTLWPGVFELKLVFNKGIAFGMFQGGGVVLTPIAIIIAACAGYYSFRNPKLPKIVHVTMALLASGAVGNLIDRIWMGKVTDMFWIRVINFPVFNVADVCITAAGFLMAYMTLRDAFRPAQESDQQVQAPTQDSGDPETPETPYA